MKDYYKRSVNEDRLPRTYVGYADGKPVGTFQFGMGDIFVRPDIYPWLKHVYVAPGFRGKGYAAKMMEFAVTEIRNMDFDEFFLFTHLNGFYEKFGWEFIETFEGYAEYGVQRLYKIKK
jgi:GNAT superfamily N-acetyltransferase